MADEFFILLVEPEIISGHFMTPLARLWTTMPRYPRLLWKALVQTRVQIVGTSRDIHG
jgi:hypothetical protein